MSKHQLRWASLCLILGALPFTGCSCENETLAPRVPGSCEPTFDCGAGFEYRLGTCHNARCLTDGDCCPGQRCNAATGACINLFEGTACTDDSACEVPGQRCIDFKDGRYCGYPNLGNALSANKTQSCVTSADCTPERTCFAHRCVTEAPCDGGCPEGSVCELDSNSCYVVTPGGAMQTATSCGVSCPEGQMLVLGDQDTMSGLQCCLLECKCETLPPVQQGQFGWYSSLAATSQGFALSAYDQSYGDLVVARYDAMGRQIGVEYVDGFPSSGALIGNPQGPRGGRGEPGPNVGQHTSIAVDAAGNLHVAYYDKDMGALRYANFSGGVWKTTIVDDAGDTGYYTSIALGPDGNPRIAYMMVSGTVDVDPTLKTALKLATAHNATPIGPSDWTLELIDSRDKPPLVCNGGCGRDEACVDGGMGPACIATTIGCGTCANNSACVLVGTSTTPECKARINSVPIDDLIEGTGLFASLAFTSTGTAMIAYYDKVEGDLRFAQADGRGGYILKTLDGNDAMNPTDVGRHCSLAIGPQDAPAIAYMDTTKDDLVYYQVKTSTREVIDNGVTPPDVRLTGADAALVFDDAGNPAVAYQDPTNINLVYARRIGSPPAWTTQVLRGDPGAGMSRGTAAGFYVDLVKKGTEGWASSVDVTFTPEGDLRLNVVLTKTRLD
ncbi:MAG: hypothetical protein U1E65_26120 [Myxococcota bacterium]